MNVTIYLFGKFKSGYSQYPNDHTVSIFQTFANKAKEQTQIAIHRDGNLMYYAYIRKLEEDKYIGFCFVLNDLYLLRLNSLFEVFENKVSALVSDGMLIQFDEKGDIIPNVNKLYLNAEQVNMVSEMLRKAIAKFKRYSVPLPPVSFAVVKDTSKDFFVDSNPSDVIASSYTNGYTYIYKSSRYNTSFLNTYNAILRKSYEEKQALRNQMLEMEMAYAESSGQKKRVRLIRILLTILGLSVALIVYLSIQLNNTRTEALFYSGSFYILEDKLKQHLPILVDSLRVDSTEVDGFNGRKVYAKLLRVYYYGVNYGDSIEIRTTDSDGTVKNDFFKTDSGESIEEIRLHCVSSPQIIELRHKGKSVYDTVFVSSVNELKAKQRHNPISPSVFLY